MEDKMSTLRDTRIVDLKRSVIDEEKSKPDSNRYVFKEKRYVNRDTLCEDNVWFCWCHYNPKDGLWMFESWKLDGWEPVIVKEDKYLVEGASTSGDGYWHYKDVVLMKCKWEDEIKRREENDKMSRGGGKARLKAFARDMDMLEPQFTQGAGVDPDEMDALRNRHYKQ